MHPKFLKSWKSWKKLNGIQNWVLHPGLGKFSSGLHLVVSKTEGKAYIATRCGVCGGGINVLYCTYTPLSPEHYAASQQLCALMHAWVPDRQTSLCINKTTLLYCTLFRLLPVRRLISQSHSLSLSFWQRQRTAQLAIVCIQHWVPFWQHINLHTKGSWQNDRQGSR